MHKWRILGFIWRFLNSISTVVWLSSIGGASVVTALVGSALVALDAIPWGLLALLLVGVFLIATAALSIVVPRLVPARPPINITVPVVEAAPPPAQPLPASAPVAVPDGSVVRIADLVRYPGERITDRTFTEVTFHGPAVIAHVGGTNIHGVILLDPGAPIESALFEREEGFVTGVVVCENCTFIRCRFLGIGFVGNPDQWT